MSALLRALLVGTLLIAWPAIVAAHCAVYHRAPHSGRGSYYPGRNYAAAQRANTAAAEQQWAAQVMAASQTHSASVRVQSAQKAMQEGNPRLAGYLLLRVGVNNQIPRQIKGTAQQMLRELRTEGMDKLVAIEERLGVPIDAEKAEGELAATRPRKAGDDGQSLIPTQLRKVPSANTNSPKEDKSGIANADEKKAPASPDDEIIAAFKDFEKLERDYSTVPVVNHLITSRLHQFERQPEFASVLKQPQAAELLKRGQQHEEKLEPCCAFLSYEAAAQLQPAPAAIEAQKALDRLKADPQVVAGAETCRHIREGHELYHRAEMLMKDHAADDKARDLFKQILDETPDDSAVHVAARQQLAKIGNGDDQ